MLICNKIVRKRNTVICQAKADGVVILVGVVCSAGFFSVGVGGTGFISEGVGGTGFCTIGVGETSPKELDSQLEFPQRTIRFGVCELRQE